MIRPQPRKYALTALLISVSTTSCATAKKPPVISLDNAPTVAAVQLADPPKPVEIVTVSTPLPLPGQLKPLPSRSPPPSEPIDPTARVALANAAARVQPGRSGFVNAIQEYPYTDGALYQVYAAPGQVSDGFECKADAPSLSWSHRTNIKHRHCW